MPAGFPRPLGLSFRAFGLLRSGAGGDLCVPRGQGPTGWRSRARGNRLRAQGQGPHRKRRAVSQGR
eukprot:11170560-Lingulodinium_polyedra.AAC.1